MVTAIKTKVLILGAGPGGYSAAFRCSDLGIHTTLVEQHSNLGGVCLNVGCIPSKALLHIAQLIKINKNAYKYGIQSENLHIDINKIRTWKNNIINKLAHSLNMMAKTRNVQVIHGYGTFLDNKTLQVKTNQEIINVIFDYAIIAAGSHSASIPNIPQEDTRIWNSTNALEISSIPKRLLIVGSGAIGLEMATIYHALGTEKIDIIETCNHIIPILDQNIIHTFTNILKKNMNFILNAKIISVQLEKNDISIFIEKKDTPKHIHHYYDALLIAVGRIPNSNLIGLEHIKIDIDKNNFIKVDAQMRTNIKNIFAIGDIIGHPMLAHKSIHEGHIAAEVISGKKRYFDTKIIPSVIYTDPEIAWTGYTEKYAIQNNIDYKTTIFPWKASGKAIISNNSEGITKLIFDKNTHRIIGGTVIGSHASEILGEISLAIEMGCDAEDISLTIHAHPTLYESIGLSASIYNESITDLLNIK